MRTIDKASVRRLEGLVDAGKARSCRFRTLVACRAVVALVCHADIAAAGAVIDHFIAAVLQRNGAPEFLTIFKRSICPGSGQA